MSDFADRPFVMGSVFGVRSFRVDTVLDVLLGPVKPQPFASGENVAECLKPKVQSTGSFLPSSAQNLERARALYSQAMAMVPGGDPGGHMHRMAMHQAKQLYHVDLDEIDKPKPPAPEPEIAEPVHRVGQMGCTCGYYAYMDGKSNPHDSPDNVLAIIEGYGLVTVGNRGFRAEKARLVAMVGIVGDEHRKINETIEHVTTVVRNGIDGERIAEPRMTKEIVIREIMIDGAIYTKETRFIPRAIVLAYPGVPVFPTLDLAVAEFPLTDPEDTKEASDG